MASHGVAGDRSWAFVVHRLHNDERTNDLAGYAQGALTSATSCNIFSGMSHGRTSPVDAADLTGSRDVGQPGFVGAAGWRGAC